MYGIATHLLVCIYRKSRDGVLCFYLSRYVILSFGITISIRKNPYFTLQSQTIRHRKNQPYLVKRHEQIPLHSLSISYIVILPDLIH